MKWRAGPSIPSTCTPGSSVTPADSIIVSNIPYVCTATNVYKSLFYTDGSQAMTGKLTLFTATTSAASMNIPSGADPTACASGDLWSTGASLKICRASTAQIIETREFKNAASGYAGLDSSSRIGKLQGHAATVYTDQANTYSTGAQDFSLATSLLIPGSAGAAPTANGSIAFDSTNSRYAFGGTIGASSTAGTGYMPRFFGFQGPSTTVTATVTETVFSTSTYSLPANFFSVGKILIVYIEAQDVMGASPVSRKYQLRLQKGGATNVYLYTPAVSTPTASATRSSGWVFFVRCVTTGTSGTVDVGLVGGGTTAASIVVNTVTQPVTIDTTAAQVVQLTQTLGATTAGETSQMRFMLLGELN